MMDIDWKWISCNVILTSLKTQQMKLGLYDISTCISNPTIYVFIARDINNGNQIVWYWGILKLKGCGVILWMHLLKQFGKCICCI